MGLIRGLCYGSCLPSANNSTSTTNINTASTMWTPYHPVRSKPQVPPKLSDVTLGGRWALPQGLAGVDSWASHLAFMGVNEGGVIPFLCVIGWTFSVFKTSPFRVFWLERASFSMEVYLFIHLSVGVSGAGLLSFKSGFSSVQFNSVAQSCQTLDPMNCNTPGLPVHHQLPEFTQTHVHRVGDVIQPSHPLSSPFPPAPNPSQHQAPFQWLVGSPCSPRDSQESSPTPQFKTINSSALSFLHSPTLTSIHDHWENHSLH